VSHRQLICIKNFKYLKISQPTSREHYRHYLIIYVTWSQQFISQIHRYTLQVYKNKWTPNKTKLKIQPAEWEVWWTSIISRDQPNSRFHAVTFSMKFAFFREKCPFPCFHEIPWNLWFFVNFNAFTFIYEGFQSFINSFCADFAVCYVSHFSTK